MKKRILSLMLAFLMIASIFPAPAHAEETVDYSADMGKYAQLTDAEALFSVHDGSDNFAITGAWSFGADEFEGELIFHILDWYWDSETTALWYRVELYSGSIMEESAEYWPETPWILQDYTDETYEFDATLTFVTLPEVTDPEETEPDSCEICGETDCAKIHVWCETCQKYDCGVDHDATEPAEPTTEPTEEVCPDCGKNPCECETVSEVKGQTPDSKAIAVQTAGGSVASVSVAQSDGAAAKSKYGVSDLVFSYDISLLDSGNAAIQPTDGATVTLQVNAAAGTKMAIVHTHNGETELLGVFTVSADQTVSFYTPTFSEFVGFTVDFHYNGVDYSIPGESGVLLSELFTALGIDEDAAQATSVVFSDESLVTVTQQENDWLLTSLVAFSTNETLVITFSDGHTIVIDVTDASAGVQTTDDQVHLSTSGTMKTYQFFGTLYPGVYGHYSSYSGSVLGHDAYFYLYEGNAYPGTGNGSQIAKAKITDAYDGVQFNVRGNYWFEVYDTNHCTVSECGTANFEFDSNSIFYNDDSVYIRRYPLTTYHNQSYCTVNQTSVMSDSKTTRTVYIYANGTQVGSWTGYFPDRTSAAASDLSVTPYGNWKGRGDVSSNATVVVSNGNYYVYLVSTHTVTWKNWDGSTLETDTNVVYGTTPAYNSATPTRATAEGYSYTFSGWTPSVSAVSSDITYTAQYSKTPISYSVSFDGNGATSGSMSNQSFTYGTAQNLKANAYQRAYTVTYNGNSGTAGKASDTATATFNGWEDRGSIVYNGTTYSYTTFDAPYYANPNKSNDVFSHANFGNGHYNKYGLLDHYVQHGAAEYANGSAARAPVGDTPGLYPNQATVSNLSTTAGYTVPLYANWTLGSVTLPDASRTGYDCIGWATTEAKADAGTVEYEVGAAYTPAANATLYAVWTPAIYKVTLDDQGATTAGTPAYWYKFNTVVNGVYYYTDSECTTALENYTIQVPKKNGYIFGGYYTETNGAGTCYVNADGVCINNLYSTVAKDTTLYALYYPAYYAVTGTIGNGTVTNDDQSVAPGSNSLAMTFTPATGYKITGIKVNGVDQTVGNEDSYTYPAQTGVTEDITVVVTTQKKQFTVTWVCTKDDTGEVTTQTTTVTYGDTITAPSVSEDYYDFSGWKDVPETMPAKDLTISGTLTRQRGNLTIKKTWSGGVGGNALFAISGNGVNMTVTTSSSITIEGLPVGEESYTVTELNWSQGYTTGGSRTATISKDTAETVSFTNVWRGLNWLFGEQSKDNNLGGGS